ncbi:hypothetical protein BDP55DRAFT_639259 [Colletotrichum godetiae]|uniref:Uncharacterized protein n=1 Tax=Colletotrichum godetiae TaxID=1209918 RepID=A0AAJ0A5J9_9PEZI|nr:uncharacterized protein BDP55DRAFT_639259 [Colletotrichum godetiae]KAK1656870.1 hypothetical protein BDP55DRAFT_639259 [Colletotrichum godetiae]
MSREKPLPRLPSSPMRPRPLMPSKPARPIRPSKGLLDDTASDQEPSYEPSPHERHSQSSRCSRCSGESAQRQSLLISQLQSQVLSLQSQLEETQTENTKQKKLISLHDRTLADLCGYITITVSDFQEQQRRLSEIEGEIPITYTDYNTDATANACNLF